MSYLLIVPYVFEFQLKIFDYLIFLETDRYTV